MDGALGARPEALSERGRRPSLRSGPEGRASDWLPPSGSGPWAGPRWAGLSWCGGSAVSPAFWPGRGFRAPSGSRRAGAAGPRDEPLRLPTGSVRGPRPRGASCSATAARPAAGADRGAQTIRRAGRAAAVRNLGFGPRRSPVTADRPARPVRPPPLEPARGARGTPLPPRAGEPCGIRQGEGTRQHLGTRL